MKMMGNMKIVDDVDVDYVDSDNYDINDDDSYAVNDDDDDEPFSCRLFSGAAWRRWLRC